MKQINVPVEDEIYLGAKAAAETDGMLFRKWIERTLAGALKRRKPEPK